jgi:hypothetical protein
LSAEATEASAFDELGFLPAFKSDSNNASGNSAMSFQRHSSARDIPNSFAARRSEYGSSHSWQFRM